jgi:hypothetical protein
VADGAVFWSLTVPMFLRAPRLTLAVAMPAVRRGAAAIMTVGFAILGCSKRDEAAAAPAASALPASTADARTPVWHYVVDPKSVTHVDMAGLKEHIRGDTSAAAGTLDVVPGDLAKSRGDLRIDLSTFSTRTFGTADDADQTKHARTWLEVQVGDKVNDEMRWAEFAIRSVDGLSVDDLTQAPVTKRGADDVRRVSMTVHGELLLHGHKAAKDAAVELVAVYPGGATAGPPARLEVHSAQPMQVVLKDYDVRPRDPGGEVLAWTTQLISKVAEVANVTVELSATPAP